MNTKKKARILVVEDDADTLAALSERLQAEGYTVLEAITGESAIHQAKSEVPDLLLLDVCLPGIGGRRGFQRPSRRPRHEPYPHHLPDGSVYQESRGQIREQPDSGKTH